MSFLDTFLLIINIVSFLCVLIISPFAITDYLFGIDGVVKLLKRLKIPWGEKIMTIIWYTSVGILLVSYFLRKILFQ